MSADAESNGTIGNLAEVVEQIIRSVYDECDRTGEKRVGRPTLVDIVRQRLAPTRVSEHLVRQAKELVDAQDTSPPDAAGDTPAATSTPPADQEPDARPLVLWPIDTTRRLADTNARLAATLESASTPEPPPAAHQPPPGRAPRPWPLALIGLAAAVAVWSGWVGLGEMAGFGPINLLPGVGGGFTVNTAVVLPISVEAYAAYALRVWLATSRHSATTTQFAKVSTITSLVVGGAAQVVYHLLAAAGWGQAPWPVTMLVSLVPVLVLGLASALAKLVSNDRQAGRQQ